MERAAASTNGRRPTELGVSLVDDGADIAVFSAHAERMWFCTFDKASGRETERWSLDNRDGDIFHGFVPGVVAGTLYGLRADGPYEPNHGHWFDPQKLLVDPYAKRLDRPFAYLPALGLPRDKAVDTASLVPLGIVEAKASTVTARLEQTGAPQLIYEVCVKAYSWHDGRLPETMRGRIDALAHPATIERLVRLGVSHVELMPVTAWIDERHLGPLKLANAWGYNPVAFMALDPRLAAEGLASLKHAVSALHDAGLSVLLDVVFNHTGESDAAGPTLSLRGLDNLTYYRAAEDDPGRLVNDTGCGNTLACDRLPVVRLIMDSLRHFVEGAGVDGFRFDLATTLGRDEIGFKPNAPLLSAITQDPVLRTVQLIAEPWDVGPVGYKLGNFPAPFLEWNDRYRDDVRKFWKGERGAIGALATRMAGSADIFGSAFRRPSASVNFIAAHDGMTLLDLTSYMSKRNLANGEGNRDGTDANYSWNNGADGASDDTRITDARKRDVRALLATQMLSRGTPMLTAGDEFGRSQNGNNNAYAQDNETTWLDWAGHDADLERFFTELVRLRRSLFPLAEDRFLTGTPESGATTPDVAWLRADATPMQPQDWADSNFLGVLFASVDDSQSVDRVFIAINRAANECSLACPPVRAGYDWVIILDTADDFVDVDATAADQRTHINGRCVMVFVEKRIA